MNAWQSDGWRLEEVAAEHRQRLLAEVEADRIVAELKRGQQSSLSSVSSRLGQVVYSVIEWVRLRLAWGERPAPY